MRIEDHAVVLLAEAAGRLEDEVEVESADTAATAARSKVVAKTAAASKEERAILVTV
jgi:hypothetical protein